MYIVDSHCDSIQQVDVRNHPLVNPYNMSQKYNQLQMVAMFCSWPHETPAECYKRVSRYMGLFSIAMDNESDKIVKVKTYADIENAFAQGKHAALLTIEGGTGIMGDPKIFTEFYNFGVRVFGLAWLHNDLAKSNKLEEGEEDTGVTDKGREIAERVYERHQVFTEWLTSIGVPPEIAAEDACHIEHDLSVESFEAIKAYIEKHRDSDS